MTAARAQHTATLLNDGRVLIVGGWTTGPAAVAEIYNPAVGPHGSFTASTAGTTGWPSRHTATLVTTGPHAGEVLIAGGDGFPTPGASYFYNPVNDTFSSAPSLLTPRLDHTATALPNGRIVFTGGIVDTTTFSATSLVEIYDPETGEQAYIGHLIAERYTHSADVVSTPNGLKLAVAAGYGQSVLAAITIEQFDLGALDGEAGTFAGLGADAKPRVYRIALLSNAEGADRRRQRKHCRRKFTIRRPAHDLSRQYDRGAVTAARMRRCLTGASSPPEVRRMESWH